MKITVILLVIASASAQTLFPSKFKSSANYQSSGNDGRYIPDNSGAYNANDGRYYHDDSGKYVHQDVKYEHTDNGYKHTGDDGGKYKSSGENHSGSNGNGKGGGSSSFKNSVSGARSAKSLVAGASDRVESSAGRRGSATGKYDNRNYAIIRKIERVEEDGYHYLYETENGILGEEQGKLANRGSDNEAMQANGFFTYTGPDNVVYTVRYTANENGFQPEGAHLPTPPPIPKAILKSLEYQKSLGLL